MTQIEVESEWAGKLGGNAGHKVKVRYVTEVDGIEYVTYEKIIPGRRTILATVDSIAFIGSFEKKDSFFEVGGTYRSPGSRVTLYVQEVFTVSNPIHPRARRMARAVFINENGKRWMQMVDVDDFDYYIERVK